MEVLVKNIEWDIKFEPRKWNIHFHIFRFRNLKDLKNAKLDVFLFLTVGYGEILNIFRKGLMFRIGLFEFDRDKDINKEFLGFTIPIENNDLINHEKGLYARRK